MTIAVAATLAASAPRSASAVAAEPGCTNATLRGDYGFDIRNNRTVAVDSRALTEALKVVYGADRLVQELQPPAPRTTGPR